jgi:hypothetical protein
VRADLRVNGHRDGPWSAWFDGLQASRDDRAETTISGRVADQATLHGLPAKVGGWALSRSRRAAPTPADHRHEGMAMQPSTHPSASSAGIAWLPPRILVLVAVAGSAGLFATFWDDAWHTDLGRDQATIPPHLLLYGSVAVVGGIVVAWGLSALLLAAAGGTVTLAAMPIDVAWHAAFGRDAVLWSPPHMLAVFGSLALLVGILAGARPGTHRWVLAGLGALLLGSAVVPVLEFETDVPQFSEALYLPVLLAASLFAALILRQVLPGPLPVAGAVGIYVLLRVAITLGLEGLGRSTPDLPLAIVGLAAVDLPWRTAAARYSGGAAAVALTALVASATGLARVPAGAVAVVAVPALVVFLVVVAIQAGRLRRSPRPSVLLLLALALALALSPTPAGAHDPGQGRAVAPVTLIGTSDGHGSLTITAETPAGACSALTPGRVIARRAGQTVTDALTAAGPCRYAGQVRVTTTGRWFLYVQPHLGARVLEAWLPMDPTRAGRVVERRDLYRPAGRPDGAGPPTGEVVSGIALYALGAFLLALILLQVRGVSRTPPARSSSLGSSPTRE